MLLLAHQVGMGGSVAAVVSEPPVLLSFTRVSLVTMDDATRDLCAVDNSTVSLGTIDSGIASIEFEDG